MANCKTMYSRFFPNEGVEIDKEFWLEELNKVAKENSFSPVFYDFEESRAYIDMIYEGRPLRTIPTLFNNEKVLQNFTTWIRLTDSGTFCDIIACNSKTISFSQQERSEELVKWVANLEEWSYAKMCLYQANQIKLNFSNPQYPSKRTNKWFEVRPTNLDSNYKECIINMDVFYYKSSFKYLDSIHEDIEKVKSVDFYNSPYVRTDGEIRNVLQDFIEFNLNKDFLYSKGRIDENLESLEFLFDNKIIERFWWNEKEKQWESDIASYWTNCADYEYLKFIESRKK